jgi:hypothetical protein
MLFDFTTYSKRKKFTFATCMFFTRRDDDYTEVYLDEIASAAYQANAETERILGIAPGDLDVIEFIVHLISTSVVHEWLHEEANLEERPVRFATEQLDKILTDHDWPCAVPEKQRSMVWSHMVCPLNKGKQHPDSHVTFDECLSCMDDAKATSCPVWELRQQLLSRRAVQSRVYHVTEITNPRRSFYERLNDYSEVWDDVWDFFFGHAVHNKVQENYPKAYREIFLRQPFTRGDERIELIGSVDAYDSHQGMLLEFKTYATLDYSFDSTKPEVDHEYQAQTYAGMAAACTPWLRPKKIRVIYLAKTRSHRGIARYREFLLDPNPPTDVEERAWQLHDAFKSNTPPARRCATWMCKFCKHITKCAEDYRAAGVLEHAEDLERIIGQKKDPAPSGTQAQPRYNKSDEQFKSYLEQHVRGVRMITKWLQSLGHEITVKEDAASTEIRKDPATKGEWENDFDVYDRTDDVKIDVKTTNSKDIWHTRARLEAVLGEPLLFYIIFLKSKPVEVRKVWADTLWKNRRHAKRHWNRSREPVYVFSKDLAEVVEADWEQFKEAESQ